jgi:hypothetical protein
VSTKASERPSKAANLEVSEVRDGLLVYQARPERVHHLNHTAAYVFELATGELTIGEIAEEVRIAFRLSDVPLADIRSCVDLLRHRGLLT